MKRKIIQLVTRDDVLFALCDDGSIWKLCRNVRKSFGGDAYEWEAMPGIPE